MMGPTMPAERDAIFRVATHPHLTVEQKQKAIDEIRMRAPIERANAQADMIRGAKQKADEAAMYAAVARANRTAAAIQNAPGTMPPLGGASDTHLRPELAPKVPAGAARPYAPGEYTNNPDGSWSSERSVTVRNRDGSYSVIPALWLKGDRPYEADNEREAARLASASKLPFRKFKTANEAERFSIDREKYWQPIENPADADQVPSLWAPPTARYPDVGPPPTARFADIGDDRTSVLQLAARQP